MSTKCPCLDDGDKCKRRPSKAKGANPKYCWKHQKCVVDSAGQSRQDYQIAEAIRRSRQIHVKQQAHQEEEMREAVRLSRLDADTAAAMKKSRQDAEKRRLKQEAEIEEALRKSRQEAEIEEALRKSRQEAEKKRSEQEADIEKALRLSRQAHEHKAKQQPVEPSGWQWPQEEEQVAKLLGKHPKAATTAPRKKSEQAQQFEEDGWGGEQEREVAEMIRRAEIQRQERAGRRRASQGTERDRRIQEEQYRRQQARRPCDDLGGFKNSDNSCYLDSLLYAILHMQSDYIDNYILFANLDDLVIYWKKEQKTLPLRDVQPLYKLTETIQHLLRDALDTIYTGNKLYCKELRMAFQQYDQIMGPLIVPSGEMGGQINWITSPLSPFDVMLQIMRIFMVPETTVFVTNHVDLSPLDFSDAGISSSQEVITSYLIDIHQNMIADFIEDRRAFVDKRDHISLTKLINSREIKGTDDIPFAQERQLLSAPLLHVHLHRIAGQNIRNTRRSTRGKAAVPMRINETKIRTAVSPDKTLVLPYGQQMNLVSIIVHWGNERRGHYVTYIKCENVWYLYNDVGFDKLKKIGSFEQLFLSRPGEEPIVHSATDFIYM